LHFELLFITPASHYPETNPTLMLPPAAAATATATTATTTMPQRLAIALVQSCS
jgi:hypothetical protein